MDRDYPHATAIYADHIALVLGQLEDPPDEWATPDGTVGPTMATANVRDGETLDPPLITVHVYEGMEFEDRKDGGTLTFEGATWFAFRADPELDYSTPEDPIRVEFTARTWPSDDGVNVEHSANEFARRLVSGRYVNVTNEEGEELEADGGREPIARLPVRVHHYPEEDVSRGPTGKVAALSTRDAEFYDREPDTDDLGFLPDGFATIGTWAGDVLDAFRAAEYDPEDYDVDAGERETVAYALVYEDPRDAEDDEWVAFEEVA